MKGTLERFTGFGRTQAGVSRVFRPRSAEEIARLFRERPFGAARLALRGAGRSYGDAALNDGGALLDANGLDRVLGWDPETGVLEVEPGVTFEGIWRRTLPEGWWPPVVPGTMLASLGGAVAMNVHGKNCFRVGPLGDHLRELELVLPTGETRVCGPDEDPELFAGVVGGMGLLGCVVRLRLQLGRVASGRLRVRAIPTASLREMLGLFEEQAAQADYLVGWVDGLASGAAQGRGVVHRADYLAPADDPDAAASLRPERQVLPPRLFGVVPRELAWLGIRACNWNLGMRAVNAAKSRAHLWGSRAPYLQPHVQFHFLLDYMPDWIRGYGPAGLIQIQPFVPRAQALDAFERILELARSRGLPPYLVVFKRHRPDRFLLSHGLDGYSLAMDFPARRRGELWSLARAIQRIAIEAGGRFYFAKDSTLTPEDVQRSYPAERLRRFRELKRKCDPEGLLQTDLVRRVWPELCGRSPA